MLCFSRIAKALENKNKNIGTEEKNHLDNRAEEDDLEIVETIQNILPSSSNQVTTVQTRQQSNKKKHLAAENLKKSVPSQCDKSCTKPKCGISHTKEDCDGKNTDSDPGTKPRKQLFTPNYVTDLSEAATDETSEHNLEISKRLSDKVADEDMVNPADTNFSVIMEKVKTKYCTPRRSGEQSPLQDEVNFYNGLSNPFFVTVMV